MQNKKNHKKNLYKAFLKESDTSYHNKELVCLVIKNFFCIVFEWAGLSVEK